MRFCKGRGCSVKLDLIELVRFLFMNTSGPLDFAQNTRILEKSYEKTKAKNNSAWSEE